MKFRKVLPMVVEDGLIYRKVPVVATRGDKVSLVHIVHNLTKKLTYPRTIHQG